MSFEKRGFHFEKKLSFSSLEVRGTFVGEDLILCVQGGDKPHIGCCVLAVPRESLTGDGTISATSSVMNLIGHKDEVICRTLAEACCKKFQCTVVCTGGFHVDGITERQLCEMELAVRKIEQEIF